MRRESKLPAWFLFSSAVNLNSAYRQLSLFKNGLRYIKLKRLSLIVRVNVVLNRTVVVDSDWRFDNLCGSHLQRQSELYHVSWWYYTLVIDLICQLRRDVIGRLSVKPWCYWLWGLVVTVKQSSTVSQIVSSPVVLSYWVSFAWSRQ